MSTSTTQLRPIAHTTSAVAPASGLGRTAVRLTLLVSLLGAALVGQFLASRQLAPVASLSPGKLTGPLDAFPVALGPWRGEDRPVRDERALYADEHLQRGYVHQNGQQLAMLWMAFSSVGADRGHHPEVCMAVAGKPEDVSQRQEIECPGHTAPIQQYCYGNDQERQLVYYWYYTLSAPGAEELTEFQQAFRRLRSRPASLTIEVFVPGDSESTGKAAHEFVRLVDQQVQALVGPGAERGSKRLPVTVIPTADPRT